MTDAEKAEMKAEIVKVTAVNPPTKAKKVTLSPKAVATLKVLENGKVDFSTDRRKYLRELAEAMLGEKLSVSAHMTDLPRIKLDDMKRLTAIVPEEDSTDHGYPLGKVVLVMTDYSDYCLNENGQNGKHMHPADCRMAMDSEIDHFLNTLQKKLDAQTILKTFGQQG
jgi:tRNA U55 pseudouridine synthase TruB